MQPFARQGSLSTYGVLSSAPRLLLRHGHRCSAAPVLVGLLPIVLHLFRSLLLLHINNMGPALWPLVVVVLLLPSVRPTLTEVDESSPSIILRPPSPAGAEVALVVVQGAEIAAEAYVPLVTAIQNASHALQVWGSIPRAPFNVADPLHIDGLIKGRRRACADPVLCLTPRPPEGGRTRTGPTGDWLGCGGQNAGQLYKAVGQRSVTSGGGLGPVVRVHHRAPFGRSH